MTSETRVPPTEITGVFGTIVKRMTQEEARRRAASSSACCGTTRAVLKTSWGSRSKAEKWDACDET